MSVILITTGGERNLLWVWNYCEAIHWSLYLISLLRAPGRWKSIWLVQECQPGISFRHPAFISRGFPSPLPNLDLWLDFPLAPLKQGSPLCTVLWKKAEDAQSFWLGFLTTDSANGTPGHRQGREQNQSTQISYQKPSKEAKQTTVPGMKPTEVGQAEILPSQPAPANYGLTACPGVWDLFWTVQGKNCAKLMGLLKEI